MAEKRTYVRGKRQVELDIPEEMLEKGTIRGESEQLLADRSDDIVPRIPNEAAKPRTYSPEEWHEALS